MVTNLSIKYLSEQALKEEEEFGQPRLEQYLSPIINS